MISASTMLRAPRLSTWEVFLVRCNCMNAARNLEKRREIIRAADEAAAKAEAKRLFPDFKAQSAKRITI